MSLQWATPESHGIAIKGYTVNYKTKKEQGWRVVPNMISAALNATTAEVTLSGLLPGTKYMVQIHSETSIGQKEGTIVTDNSLMTKGKSKRGSSRQSSLLWQGNLGRSEKNQGSESRKKHREALPNSLRSKMAKRAAKLNSVKV